MKTRLLAVLAVTLLAGCARPARTYADGIIEKHRSLSWSLAAFRDSPGRAENARAVVAQYTALTGQLAMVNLRTVQDIQAMTPAEAEKWAQQCQDRLAPIQKELVETMAAIRKAITSDKDAPTWSPMPAAIAFYGRKVYRIDGGRFYFMDFAEGYDIEPLISGFSIKTHLLRIHSGEAFGQGREPAAAAAAK